MDIFPYLNKGLRTWLVLLIVCLTFSVSLFVLTQTIQFAENRTGFLLNDPIHNVLPKPVDLSNWIFGATYFATILSLFFAFKRGSNFVSGVLLGYSFLILLRAFCIRFIALEPPVDMLILTDPIISFFNPGHFVATRDLFFSGHAATLFYFCLIAPNKILKRVLLVFCILVSAAVIYQRVHYSVDVFAGFLAALLAYYLLNIVLEFIAIRKESR